MKYRIGLDIGIASVGWCVMKHDENDEPCQIVDLGVRKFEPAEKPDTGESPSVERRIARGIRRNIRRKRERLDKIKALLQTQLLGGKEIDFSPCDIYAQRMKALDEKIDDNSLARVIYSIAKHRGFKSNRKAELKENETSKMKKAIEENSENIKQFRSVGEMYFKDEKYHETREKHCDGATIEYSVYHTRNESGKYEKTLSREDVLSEAKTLLEAQRKYGNTKIDDKFVKDVLHVIDYQRSYDEGPSYPSPYHVSFNVGQCTFFKEEKRAPKASFSYEYFTALCNINHMTLNGEKLTAEQREKLIDAFLNFESVKYGKVRKILELDENVKFGGKSGCDNDDRIFVERKFSYAIMKCLKNKDNPKEHEDLLNDIAYCLSYFKSDERRLAYLCKQTSLTEEEMQALLELDANKFGNLSIKALKMLNPELEKGFIYTDACKNAGLASQNGEKKIKLKYNELEELKDITSPVVRRSVSQTIKVVNAIIDKYGSPCAIYVELAREMNKDFSARKEIEKQQNNNFAENERAISQLKELGFTLPTGQDIIKFKLYQQQNGKCAYSQKSFLSVFGSLKNVFLNNNTQIDHIIPYSRCYDDSFNNKVLVLASENQRKGNRIPFEYFGNDDTRWKNFEAWALQTYLPVGKKKNKKLEKLLMKGLSENQEKDLNSRALNDTRYIAKFMKDLFEKYLIFAESKLSKKPVRPVNGAITSFLRKIWGIKKERFESDLHHAVDACIVSCVGNGIIQRVTQYLHFNNLKKIGSEDVFVDKSTGEIFTEEVVREKFGNHYQMPFDAFKRELEIRISPSVLEHKDELFKYGYTEDELKSLKPVFVSRMVNHKVTGAIHKQTIRSKKLTTDDKMIAVTKTKIQDLKLDKDGEIENYPEKFRKDDRALYEALRNKLREYKEKYPHDYAKKAFAEPFYKPARNPNSRNEVKTVKLQKYLGDAIEVNGGLAENNSMIRIDIYEKNGKNYFIPVYVADFYKKHMPDRIAKVGPYKNWPVLDNTYDFKFSLFKNDLIHIKLDEPIAFYPRDNKAVKEKVMLNDLFVYYISADRATASIAFETADGKYETRGKGIQKMQIEKYEVDILGNVRKIDKENRKEFC